jgi:hypothetical protein
MFSYFDYRDDLSYCSNLLKDEINEDVNGDEFPVIKRDILRALNEETIADLNEFFKTNNVEEVELRKK